MTIALSDFPALPANSQAKSRTNLYVCRLPVRGKYFLPVTLVPNQDLKKWKHVFRVEIRTSHTIDITLKNAIVVRRDSQMQFVILHFSNRFEDREFDSFFIIFITTVARKIQLQYCQVKIIKGEDYVLIVA